MEKLSRFYRFLINQTQRDDIIGDLAKDVSYDDDFPRDTNEYTELYSYLEFASNSNAAVLEAFNEAYTEFASIHPSNASVKMPCKNYGESLAKDLKDFGEDYGLLEDTLVRILDIVDNYACTLIQCCKDAADEVRLRSTKTAYEELTGMEWYPGCLSKKEENI